MNWEVLSRWCPNTVFLAISERGNSLVIVLHRATYSTVIDDEDCWLGTTQSKSRVSASISISGGRPNDWIYNWETKKTKAQLLQQTRKIYPSIKYKIQKIDDKLSAENFSIKVLFVPVARSELNFIEMI